MIVLNRLYFQNHRGIIITVIFLDIYIDVLIVINCYICWLALSLTATLTHTYLAPKLKTIGSLIGGTSSLLILMTSNNTLQTVLVYAAKLVSFFIIVLIAFYKQSVKKYMTIGAIFLVLNLIIGGAAYLVSSLLGNRVIYLVNGTVYFDVSFLQLIITTAAVYFSISLVIRIYDRICDKSHSYKVEITLRDSSYLLSAVADTGNNVTDIFSGKPVIICTGVELYTDGSEYLPIPVPYNTISGEGIIYAIKPESIYITDEANSRQRVNALVAGVRSESSSQRAIFNPKILNEV